MKITKIAIINDGLFDNKIIKNYNFYYKNNELFQIKIIPFDKLNKIKFKKYNIVIFDLNSRVITQNLINLLQNSNKYTCSIIISSREGIKKLGVNLNLEYIYLNNDAFLENDKLTQYGLDYVKNILCLNYLKGIYHYEFKTNW